MNGTYYACKCSSGEPFPLCVDDGGFVSLQEANIGRFIGWEQQPFSETVTVCFGFLAHASSSFHLGLDTGTSLELDQPVR